MKMQYLISLISALSLVILFQNCGPLNVLHG